MKVSLRPRLQGVLLRPDIISGKETTTAGGLVLTGGAQQKDPNSTMEADVIAVGYRCRDVAVGDRVVIGRYAGRNIALNGEKLLVLNENEIMGVMETSQ